MFAKVYPRESFYPRKFLPIKYIKRPKIKKVRIYNLTKLRNYIRKSGRKYYMLTRMRRQKFIMCKTKESFVVLLYRSNVTFYQWSERLVCLISPSNLIQRHIFIFDLKNGLIWTRCTKKVSYEF